MTVNQNSSSTADITTITEEASTSQLIAVANSRYTFDSQKLDDLRKRSPWTNDPKWFTSVSISPTALVKMVRSNHD
jgi:hypothetical protein